MKTVRLSFSELRRLDGPKALFPRPPEVVLTDVRLYAEDAGGACELAELVELPRWSSVDELVQRVLTLLESGQLDWDFRSSPHAFLVGAGEVEAVSLSGLAGALELHTKYGIAIELVGEDDNPIPGVEYQLVLPDGSTRTGMLDADGCAEFADLPSSGDCKVRFPTLDRDAWEHVGVGPL